MQKMMWFTCGMLVGLTALSISRASVPMPETAINQRLSEIRGVPKVKVDEILSAPFAEVARAENQFPELLPLSQAVKHPAQRIEKQHPYPSHPSHLKKR